MGLLTDPSAEPGQLTIWLLKYHNQLSALLYIIGVLWFVALAYSPMNSGTYFSENALLPGLVKSEFREDRTAERYLQELNEEIVKYPDSLPYPWILAKFQQIGLDPYTHSFTLNSPLKANETYTGKNVYGILRAARASSTEALVLNVPYRPTSSIHPSTTSSIAIMLAFAKYANNQKYWAKDIIFLISEHEQLGVQAWLEAYHDVSCGSEGILYHGDLQGRAGAIQAAITLELHDSKIHQIDIKIEGLNGQLPNLDLYNLAAKMCTKEGVVNTFKGRRSRKFRDPTESFLYNFKTLMAMFFTQAAGIPNGNHGLFHRFGIQALTMEGFGPNSIRSAHVGYLSMGRILEGTFRSLNNLLERFHQSFFFYLLPASDRYISIGNYMPSIGLIAGSLMLKACAKWCKLNELQKTGTDKKKGSKYIDFEKVVFIFVVSHLIGIILKSCPNYLISLSEQFKLQPSTFLTQTLFGFCFLALIPLFASFFQNEGGMTVLSIAALLELATAIICIAMNNFSLGMFCATIWTPFALFINPTTSRFYSLLQRTFWLVLHPVMVLTIVVYITTFGLFSAEKFEENLSRGLAATVQAVTYSIVDSMIYGNWMFSVITTILIPNWICFWCVSFSVYNKKESVSKGNKEKLQ